MQRITTPDNFVYVSFESDTIREDRGVLIDTSYNPSHHARQYGKIAATNNRLSSLGLKEGVDVIFHHFVALESDTQSNHKTNYNQFVSDVVGARCYPCDISQLFAYYDDFEKRWVGINGWVLGHPILNKQTQSDILEIVGEKKSSQDYIVRVLSHNHFCKINEAVYLTKECDYVVSMPDGNDAWAFNINDIIALNYEF